MAKTQSFESRQARAGLNSLIYGAGACTMLCSESSVSFPANAFLLREVLRLAAASVVCGRMLVSISDTSDAGLNFAVPASRPSDNESLIRRVPSARQNVSTSSVSRRLHCGQRFILKPQPHGPVRPRQSLDLRL